jgi:hypothetical protein
MDIFLAVVILLMQNVAIFLDNLSVFYLTKNHNTNKLASLFARKHQIDFLSRGFLFFTPPLLGYLLTRDDLNSLLIILLVSSVLSLFVTLIQSTWLLKDLNYKFHLSFKWNTVGLLIVGLLIYAIYMYVPFYLNILAYFFKQQSLWLVQLSPGLTMVTSIFVVYYMDPRIAKFIDNKKKNKSPQVIFEMIAMRSIGRIFIVFLALLMYFKFSI